MPTDCIPDLFGFAPAEGHAVVATFDGGRVTSDAGALLQSRTDQVIDLVRCFAGCFRDGRAADFVEHAVSGMVIQRVAGSSLNSPTISPCSRRRRVVRSLSRLWRWRSLEKRRRDMVSWRCLSLVLTMQIATVATAAELRVLSDGPIQRALAAAVPEFERQSGHVVTLVSATSPELMLRIERGETADVLVIQPDHIARLVGTGQARAAGRAAVGRVGVGLAVREGTTRPAIAPIEALRQTLLEADTIVFNSVASGNRFADVLTQLGLAEALQPKIVRAAPAEVFRRVLEGRGRDIAVGTITQIRATPGLVLLGPMPGEFQSWLEYEAVLMAAAPQPEAGRAFIAFLRSPDARAAFAAAGGEPATD